MEKISVGRSWVSHVKR